MFKSFLNQTFKLDVIESGDIDDLIKQALDKVARGESVYLLDVRQAWEHQTAHLPGAVLVPLNELQARVDEVKPPEGAQVVTYCHHGVRSMNAAIFLEQRGFREVASLTGGIEAWSLQVDPKVPRY